MPLLQGESKCETILMKTTLICMKMKLHAGSFSKERFRTYTRFETEAQENSEMVYFSRIAVMTHLSDILSTRNVTACQ